MNFNLIFLFFSLIIEIGSYIKIPFIYFPTQSKKEDNPKNTISLILDLKMYGILKIGTPAQICHIPINFGANTFFMPEKSSFHYDIKDKINLYDNRNSSSFSIIKDLDSYEGENFIDAYYANDIFYFDQNNIKLDFYLTTSYFFPQIGGLGLQLYPSNNENTATPDIEKTFFRKLKINGLINNYIWSIFFENLPVNYGEINGYILIGDYPHLSINYPSNKHNFSLNSIDAQVYNKKIIETKFIMNNVQIIKEENILTSNENFYVNLNYNFGGIIVPEKNRLYFEDIIFNNLKFCHKDTISRIFTDTFYYCDNNDNAINKLKEILPIIKFENKILNNSFIINIDNILYTQGKYIYILLIFEDSDDWTLGIPFLQEYQFSINEDSKKIYFYKKLEISQTQEINDKTHIYIILIILLLVCLFIISVAFGIFQYYRNIRKKRKNELEDNFDYTINDEGKNAILN